MFNSILKYTRQIDTKINIFRKLSIAFVLIYTLAAVLVSLNRHWQYETLYFDLGIFDQAIWNVSQGRMPMVTESLTSSKELVQRSFLGDHFTPSIYLLSPIYWITNKVEMLLIVQALVVGVSLWIGYLMAREKFKDGLITLGLIMAYGGYVGLQNAIITDFHSVTLSVFPLIMIFWSIMKEKWKQYWLWLILFLGFKESLGAVAIGLGIYLLFKNKKYRKIGISTIAVGLIYSLVVMKLIIPAFSYGGSYAYKPVIPNSLGELITLLFNSKIKVRTMLVSFGTFGFLPLLYPPLWPFFGEEFLQRFVFNLAGTRWDLGMHYNAILTPVLLVSSVEVLTRISENKKLKKYLNFVGIGLITITVFIHQFWLHGPLGLSYNKVFYLNSSKQGFMDDFVALIPKDRGLIMTMNNIAPRFTHDEVTLLKNKDNYKYFDPKVIAVDLRDGQNPNNFFSLTRDGVEKLLKKVRLDNDYEIYYQDDERFIFVKK